MKNQRISAYLILGLYFVCGLFLGFTLAKNPLPRPNSVTVDIIKENDEISIYEHYSKDLIFEYNQSSPVDSSAYQELNGLWEEVKSSGRLR